MIEQPITESQARAAFKEYVNEIDLKYGFRLVNKIDYDAIGLDFTEDLKALMGSMSEVEIARCFIDAFYMGINTLCRTILDYHGPFTGLSVSNEVFNKVDKVVIRSTDGGVISAEIKASPISLTFLSSPKSVRDHFRMGIESRIENCCISETATSIYFSAVDCTLGVGIISAGEKDLDELLDFELPSVCDGVIHNPELVIAHGERDFGVMQFAYDNLLCWSTPADIEASGGALDPIIPLNTVGLKGLDDVQSLSPLAAVYGPYNPLRISVFDLEDVSSDMVGSFRYKSNRTPGINVDHHRKYDFMGVTLGCGSTEPNRHLKASQKAALSLYATPEIKLGLGVKPGHVLCQVDIGYLKTLEIQAYNSKSLERASSFFDEAVPLRNAICYSLKVFGVESYELDSLPSPMEFKGIALLLMDDRIRPLLLKALPAPLIEYFDADSPESFHLQSEVVRVKYLGLNPRPVCCTLDGDDLMLLINNGFRFMPGSKVVTPSSLILDGVLAYGERIKAILANCEPGVLLNRSLVGSSCAELLAPFASTSILEDATRLVMIQSMPIEDMIDEAKTSAQWALVASAYGNDALAPFLDRIPTEGRVRMVESDFNL